ncbi:MAG: LysM peptidoglycan-binding domain-containing protein [Flavobacteriales bacterium]|nr:LysM peptidoglycan-binding domain-containing protein [Flavobacteriales bacterium]
MRYLTLLMISVLFVVSVNAQETKIFVKAPEKSEPGEQFKVEITVEKGSIAGFSKIQQELPQGFKATLIEANNASFSFSNNKVKFIWLELPKQEKFVVSYYVATHISSVGIFDVKGVFSYLENNIKKTIEIPKFTVTVGDPLALVPEEKTVYKAQKGESIEQIAHKYGLTEDELRKFNPKLKNKVKSGKKIYIPSLEEIEASGNMKHIVKEGENLEAIAEKYQLDKKELLSFNPNHTKDLHVGEMLLIPSETQKQASGNIKHTVEKDQTLEQVANIYSLTAEQLSKYNPGSDAYIKEGEILLIPSQEQAKSTLSKTHKVLAGETAEKIAAMYSITPRDVIRFNPGADQKIEEGDVLFIPASMQVRADDKYKHEVKTGQTVEAIGNIYGLTAEQLLQFNPNAAIKLEPGEKLIIPSKDQLSATSNLEHKVESNQTLEEIAHLYGLSQEALIKYNPNALEDLGNGESLIIPSPDQLAASGTHNHHIEKGESLGAISNIYGVSKKELLKFNSDLGENIIVGDILFIPNKEQIKATLGLEHLAKHSVHAGQSLNDIAKMYNVPSNKLIEYNPLAKDGVNPGDIIYLPGEAKPKVKPGSATSSSDCKVPLNLQFADYNKNCSIETEEVYQVIDEFFEEILNITPNEIDQVIDFFFEQDEDEDW